MRLILSTALTALAQYALKGACPTDERVITKINEARERLMSRPENWKGKIQRFVFCASRACITLPREIETVEAAAICNTPLKMRSQWYDILDGGPGPGTICGGDGVIDRGEGYVSFADLDTPRNIKVYADVPETAGARLLLQGFDENSNRVRTFDSQTNTWVDGEYVAINNETPAVSQTVFSSLDGIQKPETNGFVRIYAFTASIPAVLPTDSTAFSNWTQSELISGRTIIEWDGEASDITWFGSGSRDYILVFYRSGGVFRIRLYDINGVQLDDQGPDSFSWTDDGSGVTGELVFQTAFANQVPAFGDLAATFTGFPDPDLMNDSAVMLRVVRTVTSGSALVPEYLSLMSILHPDETLPSYRRYEIPGLRTACNGSASVDEDTTRQVIIMAKLRYLPVKRPTDFLIIENIGALKNMLLALTEEEANNFNSAQLYEQKALDILSKELTNHVGDAAMNNQGMRVQMDAWAAGNIPEIL